MDIDKLITFLFHHRCFSDRYRTSMLEAERLKQEPVPDNALSALNQCNEALFPNIHSLLITLCTLPFTSVECERNGSSLKRLKTYLRCTLGQQRLDGLAGITLNSQRY